MCFIAAVFFWLSYFVLKYEIHYVFATKCETGGHWFPKVFFLLCLSMVGFSITTFGGIVVLSAARSNVLNGKSQSAIVFATAVSTMMFYAAMCYFISPLAEFDPSTFNEDNDLVIAGEDSEGPDFRASNPEMNIPLTKLWVRGDQDPEKSNVTLIRNIVVYKYQQIISITTDDDSQQIQPF
jgi:hypothetical protein